MYPLILLAGGLATRLRPITESIPKALIEVAGKPFIQWQLEYLSQQNLKHIVIAVGYLGEMIEDFLGAGHQFGLDIHYSYDGNELLGTGGAIKKAFPLLSDKFFIMYGDSYLPIDFKEVYNYFEHNNLLALMTIFKNDGKFDKSNVKKNENGKIAYDKKNVSADMNYIDFGLSLLNKEVFKNFKETQAFDLSDVFCEISKREVLYGFEVYKRFYEVGSLEGIKEATEFLNEIKNSN